MLLATAMLEALGYCEDDAPSVWPPDGAIVPEGVVLTLTGAAPETVRLLAGGERVPLRVLSRFGDQVVLVPSRRLPPGPAEVRGLEAPVRWTVDPAPSEPRWVGEPAVRSVAGTVFTICPVGPWVTLDVPLADRRAQPLVEVTARAADGSVATRRFALADGRAVLHAGCAPALPFPPGETVRLELVGVGADGRKTEPRRLALVVADTPDDGESRWPDPLP